MGRETTTEPEGRRYRAFISYSHADKKWGRWLHRELENFGIPSQLKRGLDNPSLKPIFRDDEEIAASPDLGAVITSALERSDALVVVCSPASAASRWVDQEVRHFKSLGKSDAIFPVIVDGVPHDSERECFAPALKLKADASGALTDEPTQPYAVDIRAHGQRDTLLKLVAGLLRVDYDTLKRRDLTRARTRAGIVFTAALAVLSIYAGTVLYQARAAGELSSLVLAELARLAADNAQSDELEPDRGATYERALRFAALAARDSWLAPAAASAEAQLARAAHGSHAVAVMSGHIDLITALQFTADGKSLIVGSYDLTPRVWSVETGEIIRFLDGKTEADAKPFPVGDVATFPALARISPDGRYAVGQRLEGGLSLMEIASGQTLGILGTDAERENYAHPQHAEFSPSAPLLAVGGRDGVTRIWDLENLALVRELKGHPSVAGEFGRFGVSSILWSDDGAELLTTGPSNDAILWDMTSGAEIARANSGWSAFLPNGQAAIWTSQDGRILASPMRGGDPIASFELSAVKRRPGDVSEENLQSAVISGLSDDGRFAAISFPESGSLLLLSLDQLETHWLQRSGPTIWSVEISSSDGEVAMRLGPRVVEIYSRQGDQLGRLEGHKGFVRSVRFSPDGALLATGDENGEVRVWKTPPPPRRRELTEDEIARLDRADAPTHGFSIVSDDTDPTEGQALLQKDGETVLAIPRSANTIIDRFGVHMPSGRVAVLFAERTSDAWIVRVLDIASGAPAGGEIIYGGGEADGSFEIVKSIEFNDDGTRLALRGDLGVYVHDVETGAHLASFTYRVLGQPDRAAFSSDGATLLVNRWPWDPKAPKAFALPVPYLAGPRDRAAAGAPPLLEAVCAEKLRAGLQFLAPGDAAGAPSLRRRVGEDICAPSVF